MRYLHYDVFTSTPFEGNQLAVYPAPPPDIPPQPPPERPDTQRDVPGPR